jgi:hypothetical protein
MYELVLGRVPMATTMLRGGSVALERLRDELKCLVEVNSFYFTVNVYFILSENHHAPSSDAPYRTLVDYFKIWTLEGGGEYEVG